MQDLFDIFYYFLRLLPRGSQKIRYSPSLSLLSASFILPCFFLRCLLSHIRFIKRVIETLKATKGAPGSIQNAHTTDAAISAQSHLKTKPIRYPTHTGEPSTRQTTPSRAIVCQSLHSAQSHLKKFIVFRFAKSNSFLINFYTSLSFVKLI